MPLVAVKNHEPFENKSWPELLFERLTKFNAELRKNAYRFDSSNAEQQLGHKVSKGWDKTEDFFGLLKQGFNEYINSIHQIHHQ